MDASGKETITVEFIMEANGEISDIKQKGGGDSVEEEPSKATWASAVASSKNSPGKIYVWVKNKWKCIKV